GFQTHRIDDLVEPLARRIVYVFRDVAVTVLDGKQFAGNDLLRTRLDVRTAEHIDRSVLHRPAIVSTHELFKGRRVARETGKDCDRRRRTRERKYSAG